MGGVGLVKMKFIKLDFVVLVLLGIGFCGRINEAGGISTYYFFHISLKLMIYHTNTY